MKYFPGYYNKIKKNTGKYLLLLIRVLYPGFDVILAHESCPNCSVVNVNRSRWDCPKSSRYSFSPSSTKSAVFLFFRLWGKQLIPLFWTTSVRRLNLFLVCVKFKRTWYFIVVSLVTLSICRQNHFPMMDAVVRRNGRRRHRQMPGNVPWIVATAPCKKRFLYNNTALHHPVLVQISPRHHYVACNEIIRLMRSSIKSFMVQPWHNMVSTASVTFGKNLGQIDL